MKRRDFIQLAGAAAIATGRAGASSPLFVTSAIVPGAVVGQFYSAALTAVGGSGSGYVWSIVSGSLIAGLVLDASSGVISGMPASIFAANVIVQVMDSKGNMATAAYSIPVTNPQTAPTGTLTNAAVTVDSTAVGTVGANFVGRSYGKNVVSSTPYLFSTGNSSLIALLKLLGPNGVLRIGGTQVDESVWTPAGAGGIAGQVSPADLTSLAEFMAALGWQCLYGVNLGGAALGWAYPTSPALAAEEVAYLYGAFEAAGALPPWIEIGNECDQYANKGNPFVGLPWSLATFETLWSTYRAAILAGTPHAIITGPASGNHETDWTVPFGNWATSSNISLLTQHYYRAQSPGATSADLIAYPDTTLEGYLAALSECAQAIGVPLRLSETNSFNSAGSSGTLGVANGYGSALWVLDHMFTCALGGCSGVNLSGDSDQPTGYQPMSDKNGAIVSVNPEYYGMLLFALAGTGTLLQTAISAGSLNVSAYAIKSSSGGVNLIINNKDQRNLQVSLALPEPIGAASLLAMTDGANLSASTGVTIQGAAVSIAGSFSPAAPNTLTVNATTISCYVPALSAVLVQMTPPSPAPVASDLSVTAAYETPASVTLNASGVGALTYSVVMNPSHGILTGNAPNLIYTPVYGFSGLDNFTFKANNGADSNLATVSLAVLSRHRITKNDAGL